MQSFLNPEKLVFFDESFAKTNMVRQYGRAPIGTRLVEYVPHGHWITTTFACCLRLDGLCAPWAFDGAMNKVRFLEYVQKMLTPCLNKGDVLVMDNLQSHKNPEARRILREEGVKILYLPPCSPDMNPIEMCFSKIKGLLHKEKIRQVGLLHEFLLSVGKYISPRESRNYFKYANYTVHTNY